MAETLAGHYALITGGGSGIGLACAQHLLRDGATVTLLGRDGDRSISPRDWSERCDSIPWEVLCGFKHRLPRVTV